MLLLSLAACSASDDGDTTSDDSAILPVGNGGAGAERADGDDGASTGTSSPVIAGPSSSSPGGVAGGSVGGTSAMGAGGVAVGGGGVVGGAAFSGEASAGAPPAGGVAAPTDPVSPPTTVPAAPLPPQQSRALTAGAWDDNLNYERFRSFMDGVKQKRSSGILPIADSEYELAHTLFKADQAARTQLDVALVIDTTGSMGDEIAYLQREFASLSRSIELAYPQAEQRWALVVYKDQGDEYVTRQYDFRTDLEDFRVKLAQQSASGGGDFPEAPEAAFEVLNQFTWRTAENVARLAFWVADAPHHDQHAEVMAEGIRAAQANGVHVYPVASSGIDEFTELGMRSAAQLTGGRYLFLTNDSGIGGNHKEPSIPCYFVTSLNDAITRMVAVELSGKYQQPEQQQILRTGGDPKDGACTLASGTMLQVF
jgi:hypothetical protein